MSGETAPSVLVFPFYATNPWSDLLYRSLRDTGYDVIPADDFDTFTSRVGTLGAGDVVHVQWTAAIADGRDAARGRERAARFLALVSEARSRGATLIWTVHNAIAHDATNPAVEVELARSLASMADVVHVLNPATASEVADLYQLREETTTFIPHSGYQGVYPDEVSRSEARASFGLESDAVALLHFGQSRPYRGADLLAEAVAAVPRGSTLRLLSPGADRVPDVEVQRWFRAADLTVLPYRAVLNSGATQLSATFGVPVMLPDRPALRAVYADQAWVHWFDPDAVGGLATALADYRPDANEGTEAKRFAERYPPRAMSDAFRDLVEAARADRLARPAIR
jgi:beta-1,4-mannosyltransferase